MCHYKGLLPSVRTFGIIIITVVFQTLAASARDSSGNLIRNPFFELIDSHEPWILSVRSALWTFKNATSDSPIGIKSWLDDSELNNNKALRFESHTVPPRQTKALVASQYVNIRERHDVQNASLPLVLSFTLTGSPKDLHQLTYKLDIVFEDGSVLIVNDNAMEKSEESDDSNKIQVCTLIPSYGAIRALMLHFVIEGSTDDMILIDDVDLHFVQESSDSLQCPEYQKSVPSKRKVLYNYLTPDEDDTNERISIATQLTVDRLSRLAEMANTWQGPVSAAVLLLCSPSTGPQCEQELLQLSERYAANESLKKYVTFHVVFQDAQNNIDNLLYPANYLRNIALANCKQTLSRVFLLDVDTLPSMTAEQMDLWIQEADRDIPAGDSAQRRAYIAPLINSKDPDRPIPGSKAEVLRLLMDEPKVYETYAVASHGAVQYHKWMNTDSAYRIPYRLNMEPYFVTSRQAPLMNDLFVGYGRDKCAYSREVYEAGFEFVVLPHAFLVNKPDGNRAPTIIKRKSGVSLNVFLNTMFHEKDIEHGFVRLHYLYQEPTGQNQDRFCSSDTNQNDCKTPENKYSEKLNGRENVGDNAETSMNLTNICNTSALRGDMLFADNPNLERKQNSVFAERKSSHVDEMMHYFRAHVYMEVPSARVTSSMANVLPLMHPDAVVAVLPNHSENATDVSNCGLWFSYACTENVTACMRKASTQHVRAKVVSVSLGELSSEHVNVYVRHVLSALTSADLVLLDGVVSSEDDLLKELCELDGAWRLHKLGDFYVLKSENLLRSLSLDLPPLTMLHGLSTAPSCHANMTTTDIILFTKNRPLQTLAFLESLAMNVKNIAVVHVIVRVDNKDVQNSYLTVFDCIKSNFPAITVDVVYEPGTGKFAATLLSVLRRITSAYTVLCVDEIIWLHPVDLAYASCLMNVGGSDVGSFQLRLGHNYRKSETEEYYKKRFYPLAFDNSVNIYYPRYHRRDHGYVTNIDGTLIKTDSLLKDFEDVVTNSPSNLNPLSLELKWLRRYAHIMSRKWHLMFTQSRLVNNMALGDGQVAKAGKISDKSLELAAVISQQQQKINVEKFIDINKNKIKSSHAKIPVEYSDLTC